MREDRRTDIKKLIDAYCNFAKAPKILLYYSHKMEIRVHVCHDYLTYYLCAVLVWFAKSAGNTAIYL
jgi:hypothetical protein